MTEKPLPKSESKVEFVTRRSYRRPRYNVSLGHAVRVDSVRIGTKYNGDPVWSRDERSRALCDVQTDKGQDHYDAPVNCRKCIAKLRQIERTGVEGKNSAKAAVAATEMLAKVYAVEDAPKE